MDSLSVDINKAILWSKHEMTPRLTPQEIDDELDALVIDVDETGDEEKADRILEIYADWRRGKYEKAGDV